MFIEYSDVVLQEDKLNQDYSTVTATVSVIACITTLCCGIMMFMLGIFCGLRINKRRHLPYRMNCREAQRIESGIYEEVKPVDKRISVELKQNEAYAGISESSADDA